MSSRFRGPQSPIRNALAAVLLAFAAFLCGPLAALSHEGHDHGDEKPAGTVSARPRVVAQSENYEVVGILKGDRLSIYVDHFATNEPLTDATVAVTIGEGEAVNAEPADDGTYAVSSERFAQGGQIEVVFDIKAKGGDDLLIGNLSLPRAETPVAAAPGADGAKPWMTWAAWVPLPARNPAVLGVATFVLGMLFGYLLRQRRVVPAVVAGVAAMGALALLVGTAYGHEGHDHGDEKPAAGAVVSDAPRRLPDGTVFVAKPTQRLLEVRTTPAKPETAQRAVNLIGRVIADPNRSGMVQSLNGGRVIALQNGLPRIGQTVRKGDALAQIEPTVPQADRTTISDKMGEIEQLIAVAEARLKRLRLLAEKNAAPQSQVIDAEIELDGLRKRREVILQMRAEPEILRAPTDGVIANAKVVPGQVVQAQDILFQIVDPKALWVEALVYGEVDPASLADATATSLGGQPMRLTFQGFSRALQQHAAVVQFAVQDPPTNVSVGQPVTVAAKSGAPMTGLVLARDAVVRASNGETIVWQHVEPERFEPRPVRIQPLDATRLIAAAGVKEGERIVVRAADLVNQIR